MAGRNKHNAKMIQKLLMADCRLSLSRMDERRGWEQDASEEREAQEEGEEAAVELDV
jgi:hypothetical protein